MHSSLVGRREELAALDAALTGDALGVVLVGEPGIGKSRLLEAGAERAAELRYLVLDGRASEFEQDLPFAVWRQALDNPVFEAAARFASQDAVDELAVLLPALRPSADAAPLVAERHHLHDQVRRLLSAIAADRPLVLLLDDLHWADEASAALLISLLMRPPGGRVVLMLALRPRPVHERLVTALDRAVRDRGLLRLDVGPLDDAAADALTGSALPPEVRAECGGNPLFLQQLARARPGGRLPGSISAAIGEELRELEAAPATVLQAAALVGDPFELDLVAAAAELDEPAVLAAVDALLATDLIRPATVPRRFTARHPLVRRVVAERTGAGWAIAAHERVVAALTARQAPPDRLAHHVARSAKAGDVASAALLEQAAAAVVARAPATAVEWLAAARGLLEATTSEPVALTRVLRSLGATLGALGRPDEAHAVLVAALALPLDASERVEVQLECATLERRLGRQLDAQKRLEETLAEAPSDDRSSVLLALAVNAFYGRELEAAMAWAHQCAASDDAVCALGGRAVLAFALTALGDTAAARHETRLAATACDALSDAELQREPEAVFFLCAAEMYLEHLEPLVAHARRGIEAARKGRHGAALAPLEISYGFGLLLIGQVRESRTVLELAVDGARLGGSPFDLAWLLVNLTWAALLSGDSDAALAAVDEALELGDQLDSDFVHGYLRGTRAMVLVEAGDAAAALDAFADHGNGAVHELVPGAWGVCMLELQCRAELELGRAADAARTAELAERRAEALDLRAAAGWAARARGHVALAARDADGAAASAERSVAAFEAIGMPVEAAIARRLQGRALATAGDRDAAVSVLTQALDAAAAAGAESVRAATALELRRLRHRPRRGAHHAGGLDSLSAREREIADLVADGLRNGEIAAALYVTVKTVESHLRSVFTKLPASSRAEVARAVQRARELEAE